MTVTRFADKLGRGAWKMFTGVGVALQRIPTRLSIEGFAMLATLWMLTNHRVLFPEPLASNMQTALIVYILFRVAFIASFGVDNPLEKVSIASFFGVFSLAFILSAIVLLSIADSVDFIPTVTATGGVLLLAVTVFVVAYSEEVGFREVLVAWLDRAIKNRYASQVVSAGLFAVFHWAVYGGAWAALGIAFVAGCFFGLLREVIGPKHGLTVTIAVHSAYNAFVLGLL